ncbi:MAG TPA: TetR/AcrR family transcriptional regulator [Magnetospirillaceae bacterium]|nr:TetR/AcrR family transcriptional regulator [Magnetospirillaceae bacterium]
MDRKPRADSLRNRDLLLTTAKAAFAEAGAEVALEEIARRAGVGIGTLYRHFPTRSALLAGVYQREIDQLTGAADALLREKAPAEAMEAWLNLLIDYLTTKRVVVPALKADEEGVRAYASATAGSPVSETLKRLARTAAAAGEIRSDTGDDDVYRMLIGITHGYEQPGWEASGRRLVSILMAGLRRQGER